jgi:3-deoxy-D-manno-octulosonic-acid transferase
VFLHQILYKPEMQEWKYIIVPHEIDETHIKQIEVLFGPKSIRYSSLLIMSKTALTDNFEIRKNQKTILILDRMGMLSSLYRFSTVAYIGNGFGKGIHNSLEAAVFGKPIVFGPHYQKFKEARDLVALKAAFSFNSLSELEDILDQLQNDVLREKAGLNAKKYCLENRGATDRIFKTIQAKFIEVRHIEFQ